MARPVYSHFMPIASPDVVHALVTLAEAGPAGPPAISRVSGLVLILIVLSILVLSGIMWAVMRTARRVSRGPRTTTPPAPTRKTPDAWFEAGRRMPVPPDPSAPPSAATPGKDEPS